MKPDYSGKKKRREAQPPERSIILKPGPAPATEDAAVSEEMPEANGHSEVVGGLNAVLAALNHRPRSCRTVMVAEGRHRNAALDEIFNLIRRHGLGYRTVPRQALDRTYGRPGHQGVVALFDRRDYLSFEDFLDTLPPEGPVMLLALDQVEDPGNLGALMRSALAFGAAGVIVPRERSAALTPTAVNAAAGAAEVLPLIRVVNLRRSLEVLQKCGFWLAAAEEDGETDLFSFEFPERLVMVLGSEGRGVSPNIKKTCDYLLAIPQERNHVASLNVSVAGAIFMCEFFRRFR
ncbi:23S rRNA (guanosine(2251)-2'-O)-methyltransferase RlmB [Deltaproteobacteria bacterium Smac51]|nr:23S rRNA (guanosine(2251)-2'-O)-methyltransferase RlmB [Deltaproteobacteria bacterium Smac51]